MKTSPRFEDILSPDNLRLAWHKVSLGRSSKKPILDFHIRLDENLAALSRDLADGSYRPGPLETFVIKDPKERVISAAGVRDRVAFHAVMNVYDPVFDRHLIHDSYACRMGKGTHKAVLRAFHFAKSSRFFLIMDVRKYFYSIDHAVLKEMLARLVRDGRTLDLFRVIVDSSHAMPGKGVPIGNLTSQYFANHYLSPLDHRFKERLRVRRYLRYMDDILIFGNDLDELKGLYLEAVSHAGEKLGLALKPQVVGTVAEGAPFLGFLVRNSGIYLQQKTKRRYRARIAELERKLGRGTMGELEAGRRAESLTSHLLLARSRAFRDTVLYGRVVGIEPRSSRRKLEQFGGERAFRVSEQQRPIQPEQQQRLPSCPPQPDCSGFCR